MKAKSRSKSLRRGQMLAPLKEAGQVFRRRLEAQQSSVSVRTRGEFPDSVRVYMITRRAMNSSSLHVRMCSTDWPMVQFREGRAQSSGEGFFMQLPYQEYFWVFQSAEHGPMEVESTLGSEITNMCTRTAPTVQRVHHQSVSLSCKTAL